MKTKSVFILLVGCLCYAPRTDSTKTTTTAKEGKEKKQINHRL